MPPSTFGYNTVLYPSFAFPQTHPGRLAAMGQLFGMNPAPAGRCRVLELGCANGGNLIPMAYALPGSEFVGVDLGAVAIARGQETIRALGLKNVTLECRDLMDLGEETGRFDYIIAHGLYSWVPRGVQDRILAICRRNLNPHGIAYVSYIVYPGAHIRSMMAEMLQYRARGCADPQEQIAQAQAMLVLLASTLPQKDPCVELVRHEADRILQRRPEAVFHDELSECQLPMYFREFAARAARERLQYLAETDFFMMVDALQGPEVSAALRQIGGGLIEKEQYLDFVNCRRFRQSLLVQAETPLKRQINATGMKRFYAGAAQHPGRQPKNLPSDHPSAKALQSALTEAWPGVLSLAELRERTGESDEALLCDLVQAFFVCGFLHLHQHRPLFASRPGPRPRASALARLQAQEDRTVTNLCHESVNLEDELSQRLLIALDGSVDRSALLDLMRPHADADRLPTLEQDLDGALQSFAKLALLET